MQTENTIVKKIEKLGAGKFDPILVNRFLEVFSDISSDLPVIDYILQVRSEKSAELSIGFFNATEIVDVTLSGEEIYLSSYPVETISKVFIEDHGVKTVLKILGEKKIEYKVTRPESIVPLLEFEKSLKDYLSFRGRKSPSSCA